jgi:NAD(P)-dependent dehydrogenase (short-subunit alcohol dehydrogenase family)
MTGQELRGDGKVAWITGAASGLGRAVAQVFGAAGYRVAVVDIDVRAGERTAAELASGGITTRWLAADVSRNDEVERAIAETDAEWDRLDFVMNNAGIVSHYGSIDQLDDQDMARVLDVDLKGPLQVCKHAVRAQRAHGGGSILNVASISGERGSPYYAAYGAAKAGVIALTRAVAREVGRFNIRVNCLSPGSIAGTDLMAAATGPLTADQRRRAAMGLARQIPLGRPASTEDVANVALFLASPLARHIHGAVLTVDGGESLN